MTRDTRHTHGRKALVKELYGLLWQAQKRFGLWNYELFNAEWRELPEAGVYFFFEPGEYRDSGEEWRVVRVGTHRVGEGGQAIFSTRLRNHFGAAKTLIGRSSVFRDHVGAALFGRDGWENHAKEITEQRHGMVSTFMRSLSFVYVPVDDRAGRNSERRVIEMGAVSLLSNYGVPDGDAIDPPSPHWLGLRCETTKKPHDHIVKSGLWNIDGVRDVCDPEFLAAMQRRIEA